MHVHDWNPSQKYELDEAHNVWIMNMFASQKRKKWMFACVWTKISITTKRKGIYLLNGEPTFSKIELILFYTSTPMYFNIDILLIYENLNCSWLVTCYLIMIRYQLDKTLPLTTTFSKHKKFFLFLTRDLLFIYFFSSQISLLWSVRIVMVATSIQEKKQEREMKLKKMNGCLVHSIISNGAFCPKYLK